MQPRALWLAARHVPLRAALDGQWAALLKALTDALSGNEEALRRRRSDPYHACAKGLGSTAACPLPIVRVQTGPGSAEFIVALTHA